MNITGEELEGGLPALGLLTSKASSLTKDVVTIKKISNIKTWTGWLSWLSFEPVNISNITTTTLEKPKFVKPLRINYSKPIMKKSYDKTQILELTVSTKFWLEYLCVSIS